MMFGFDERYAMFDVTPVDNQFIQEYLPAAKGDYVKVYLYGLMRCYHPEEDMNTDRMCRELNLDEEEILAAYRYWERRGLVRRISDEPPTYRYVNIQQRSITGEAVDVDPRYEAFADSLYAVFDHGRRLHGSEISTCYEWVEELKLSPEAVIMLLKHMASVKGKNFSFRSAEQLAVKMAEEKVHTLEDAEAFLSRDQALYDGTRKILRHLGKRNYPSEDQLAMYKKWTAEWGFTHKAIEEACAETAKGDPSMGYLDGILRNLHARNGQSKIIDEAGVAEAREKNNEVRKLLSVLGKGSLSDKTLELYDRMAGIYPREIMLLAARECAARDGKPEDVMKLLTSWKKKGLETEQEVRDYIAAFREQSELLRELREIWGLGGRAGEADRAILRSWQKELGFDREMILFTARYAAGTEKPMAYLDKVLRGYAEKGIRTAEAAQKEHETHVTAARQESKPAKQVSAQQYEQRDYSREDESFEEIMQQLLKGESSDA